MPTPSKGEIRFTDGTWQARVTLKGKLRLSVRLPGCRTEAEAEARAQLLSEQARRLRKAGHIESRNAREMLTELGAARSKSAVRDALVVIAEMCGVDPNAIRQASAKTFREVGEEWTGGKLHARFPDQIEPIDQAINAKRLERGIYPTLGPIAINEVTREHCDETMRALPVKANGKPLGKSSRRHYAQLINRILGLAELAGYIDRSPLPRKWLPKPGPKPRFPILYPAEDRTLLACTAIPLSRRLLWGFMHREGMRRGEPAVMTWSDLDLEHGTVNLDENKTDKPRWWVLAPGVSAALAAWKERRGDVQPDDRVFTDEHGRPLQLDHIADVCRADLRLAGLTRADLYTQGPLKGHFGTHCFRRSLVTRSLANGVSEDWVRQRTGHTTDELRRYRQAAQSLAELSIGDVDPLIAALPELDREPVAPTPPTALSSSVSTRRDGPTMAPRTPREGGGTGRRAGFRFDRDAAESPQDRESIGAESPETAPNRAPLGPSRGDEGLSPIVHDPVEAEILITLREARAAGAWEVVAQALDDLREIRRSQSGVIDFEAARRARGGK
jgi:integrase